MNLYMLFNIVFDTLSNRVSI